MRRLMILALAVSAGSAPVRSASACGGLFCGNVPVVQSEEGIIFDVAPDGREVTAIINIVYQGQAEDFAWLLPLQTPPASIDVGSRQAFVVAETMTRPQFRITSNTTTGICTEPEYDPALGVDAGVGAASDAGYSPGGVVVVQQEDVGPYETVVLESESTESIQAWLTERDYNVTQEMIDAIVPYVAQGDVVLALRLKNDSQVGEIAPLEVVMQGSSVEACIPIRLTAIAATTGMPITAYVFADSGRAIPRNYFHVKTNLVKIDWFRSGSNYRQIAGEAMDEAEGGHAFVTEFAGSPLMFRGQIRASWDEAILRSKTDLADFLQELGARGLLGRAGIQPILARHFQSVANCPGCFFEQFRGETIDPNPAVDEIKETIIEPDDRAETLMTRRRHFTRLLTMLDPDEMTIDPVFAYDPNLPNVSNFHNARVERDCGMGGTPGSAGTRIYLEDGRVIEYGTDGSTSSMIDNLPSAERVDQLADGTVVQDNRSEIDRILEESNAKQRDTGCGCRADGVGSSGLLLFVLLGAGLLLARRR